MGDCYVNGFIEQKGDSFSGKVTIDGITLSPIIATYFKKGGDTYIWLRREDVMEYDFDSQRFFKRKAEPQWECYLKKEPDGNTISFRGDFVFMKFRYSVCGIWDRILGTEKNRLNLFIERKPMSEQTLLIAINKQRRINGRQ